jgi:N-acyl-D-aspartate/D-glutamate deacylase
VDAAGLYVTPGFVDIHTHLDGHVTWQERLTPTSQHGVTTVLFGNCGVGFAPCKPEDRNGLVALMEGVEDIPEPVLVEGLPWNWVSFPEYLDSLSTRHFDIDIGAPVPHGPIRVFVMGKRALDLEEATSEDRKAMAAITREAIEAGAFGFSTSRSINHRASTGNHTPTLEATQAELVALAEALRDAGGGVMQIISDFEDVDAEFAIVRAMAGQSGQPISMTVLQLPHAPTRWRQLLAKLDSANADGLTVRGQVCGRPVGGISGFGLSFCPFSFCPAYQELNALDFEAKLAKLRDPAIRARIIEESKVPLSERQAEIDKAFASRTVDLRSTAKRLVDYTMLFPIGDPPDYVPSPEKSIAAIAEREQRHPADVVYDIMLERDGQGMLYGPGANYSDGNLDAAGEMLVHPHTILGLSDAGAHCSLICDATFSTFMLTHWVRDRQPNLPIEQVVRALSAETAHAVGFDDRGMLKPGLRADINLIDLDALTLHPPRIAHDLPAGGKRLTQDADGYRMTLVAGVPTYRDGQATGALPGRLVRRQAVAA